MYLSLKNYVHALSFKEPGAAIGQRLELSEKDAVKLQIMYSDECARRPGGGGNAEYESSADYGD